jgi:hypothetical protein
MRFSLRAILQGEDNRPEKGRGLVASTHASAPHWQQTTGNWQLFVPTKAYRPYFAVNWATPIECSSINVANFAGGESEPSANFLTLSA